MAMATDSADDAIAKSTRITRSASITNRRQNSIHDASELRSRAVPIRIPSPTKVPAGTMKRSQSVRQHSAATKVPPSRPHVRKMSASTINVQKSEDIRKLSNQNEGRERRRSISASSGAAFVARKGSEPSKTHMLRRASRPIPGSASQTNSSRQGEASPEEKAPDTLNTTHKRQGSNSSRPVFNNSQQNYAPRKSVVKGHAISSAIVAQTQEHLESTLELAQLHMVHSKSASTQAEWIAKGRQASEKRFKELIEFKQSLENREQVESLQSNAQIIMSWMSRAGSDTLERRIKVVSKVMYEFWQLSCPGGRYAAVVEAFEHWYDAIVESQAGRRTHGMNATSNMQLVSGLGDGWKAEVESLQDRLLPAAQHVLSLGEINPKADLAHCVALLSEMLQNMLEELEALTFIEQSVVLQEQYWMQASIDQLTHGLNGARLRH